MATRLLRVWPGPSLTLFGPGKNAPSCKGQFKPIKSEQTEVGHPPQRCTLCIRGFRGHWPVDRVRNRLGNSVLPIGAFLPIGCPSSHARLADAIRPMPNKGKSGHSGSLAGLFPDCPIGWCSPYYRLQSTDCFTDSIHWPAQCHRRALAGLPPWQAAGRPGSEDFKWGTRERGKRGTIVSPIYQALPVQSSKCLQGLKASTHFVVRIDYEHRDTWSGLPFGSLS